MPEAVRQHHHILPRGGSKTALSTPGAQDTVLDLRGLTGILEYQPDEYTLTALAGTPVAEIEAALAATANICPCRHLLTVAPRWAARWQRGHGRALSLWRRARFFDWRAHY
ncbi:MAG: FAD-binding protein [Caldilineaceae bacterium]